MTDTLYNDAAAAGSIARVEFSGAHPPTPRAGLDTAVAELTEKKDVWATLDLVERIEILDRTLLDIHAVADEWVAASILAKGVQGNDYAEGEEWLQVALVFRTVRLLANSLRDIQRSGRPRIPGPVDTLPNGQVRARVFPVDRYDGITFTGMTADVWMLPGETVESTLDSQAWFYKSKTTEGKVTLILGAGNQASALPTDFLYKLYVEGSVVIVKMNPVNDYIGPIISKAFRELIERGFMRIVYGGAEEGNHLCHHPHVDELHMTGSDKTFEAIVFGPGEEGARRKEERKPLLEKPFTCELGNISPVIIVPGPWTEKEIDSWGEKLARWLVINAGFNCITPRLIIQAESWEHRQSLNDAIARNLAMVETRHAYYPDAHKRHQEFLKAHPDCLQQGSFDENSLPWTFIQGVDASHTDDICFKNEAFCGLFAETALPAKDAAVFLEEAVHFANEHLWGNLAATLVVHPDSLKNSHTAAAVDRAVADLDYGTVLLNQFAGSSFFAMSTTWGGFPGNDIYDVQSGIGVVCNTLMFRNPQKTVLRSPFTLPLDPMSLQSRTVSDVTKQLTEFQYQPSPWKIPGLLWSSIRS